MKQPVGALGVNVMNTELNDVFMLVVAGMQFLEGWKNHKICATELELLAAPSLILLLLIQSRGVISLLESTYFSGFKAL